MKCSHDWLKDHIPKLIGQGFSCAFVLICVFYVFDVPSYFGIALYDQQYFGLLLGLSLSSLFLLYPRKKEAVKGSLPWYDFMFVVLSLVAGVYVTVFYPDISLTIGDITPLRVILGAVFIIIILEAVRRTTGWALLILVATFILYARYTHYAPGNLYGEGIPWTRLASFIYLDPNAVLGLVSKVTFGVVVPFILFGLLLFAVGGGKFLTALAMGTMGRYSGGPAKVAVLASAFFGSMSGSAVSNVVTTGIITIPMMKKVGFRSDFAAAVESVASSGGALLPPVMGAAAFLVAEFLEIPYIEVVIAASVPAIMYYIILLFAVHLRAAKKNIEALSPQELPSVKKTLAKGWLFFLPVGVLAYALFILDLEAGKAGLYASASIIVIGLLRKETRKVFRNLPLVFAEAGQTTHTLVAVCAAAGVIMGIVTITGLGFGISEMLIDLSGGNLIALLFLTAIGCIIMGMGLPVTASYIIVVVLCAPALIQAGIEPLAAHLFVLYFAVMSFITPPICLAVYAACSISGSDLFRTAFIAVRLGAVAYLVPFFFALDPTIILLKGSAIDKVLSICTITAGIAALQVAWEGYLFSRIGWFGRVIMLLGAVGLLLHLWMFKLLGLGLVVMIILFSMPSIRMKLTSRRTGRHNRGSKLSS